MDASLRAALNDYLRPLGFTGSLPHYRRIRSDRIDLLTVQHALAGGSFVVEVAVCAPTGTRSAGQQIPSNKVTAHHIGWNRCRVGSPNFPTGDHWFLYGKPNYEPGSQRVRRARHYDRVAARAVDAVARHATTFWDSAIPIDVDDPTTLRDPRSP